MPLVFSPLSDEVIDRPPRSLFPKHAFLMRQIGEPPQLDSDIAEEVKAVLDRRGFKTKDADDSTGGKDFLERILGLIRGTGLTIAIFSHHTRPTALANIMLELGFAAMCGKPLMIVKSRDAAAPSDLKRTDWIDFDANDLTAFRRKIDQAIDQVQELAGFEEEMLDVAIEAPSTDCAVAFERAQRAFLLGAESRLLDKIELIQTRLAEMRSVNQIDDLNRLHDEISMFIRQGRRSLKT